MTGEFKRLYDEKPEGTLTAEQQLRNVALTMLAVSEVKRRHNGRGRAATYKGNADVLALTGRQLAEMVLAHRDGRLAELPGSEIPF